MTLDYLDQLLLQYPTESRQTASEIVGGFQEAIDDIEDINMDDMDEAYNMLYQNLMTMPTFQGIQSRLAAITLAKFFLDKFQYLPTPSIPLIQSAEAMTNSHRQNSSSLPHRRSSSIDSNENSQARTQQSPALSNHTESAASNIASSRPQRVTPSRLEQARESHAAIAAAAIHHQAAIAAAGITRVQNLTDSERIMLSQRQLAAATQMQVAAAAAGTNASGVRLPVHTVAHQIVHPPSVTNHLTTNPQQPFTIYGPHGQGGIRTQFPPAMAAAAASVTIAANSAHHGSPRLIAPRLPSTSVATSAAIARHNLPLQIQPQRQPFR